MSWNVSAVIRETSHSHGGLEMNDAAGILYISP